MKIKRLEGTALFIFLIITAIIFYVGTFSIKQTSTGSIGMISPRTFPRFIIILLVVSSIASLVTEWRKEDTQRKGQSNINIKLFLSMASMLITIILINQLGFIIVGIFFLSCQIILLSKQYLEKKHILKTLIFSTIVVVILTVLFSYGFNIQIPLLLDII